MSHPHSLTGLTPREAITDVLYRVVIAFDENNIDLFNSCFASSKSSEVTVTMDGRAIVGLPALRAGLFGFIGPMDTTHILSNIRIDLKDGADTASLTATAMNMHCPAGQGGNPAGPKFLAGTRYKVEFGKIDGEWKVEQWVANVVWRQGDATVMQRPG